LKDVVCGSMCGVMHIVKVVPSSSDKKISISHPPASVLGSVDCHSTVTCSPGGEPASGLAKSAWLKTRLQHLKY
jgi:hypothetical protein